MKILMVCLGNICRSPLAHGIMESLVKRDNLDWVIDSAGTGDLHVGQAPDERSIAVAKRHGIDIANQRAQLFQVKFFDTFDRILVMDRNNLEAVRRLARNQDDLDKIALFLPNDIVPDPYTDSSQFTPVYELIADRCEELLDELKKGIYAGS